MLQYKPLNKTSLVLTIFVVIGIGTIALGCVVMYVDWHDKVDRIKRLPDHILAIVAIVYGIAAVLYEWRLHRAFATQEKDIRDIVLSVHTRYLGDWPGYLRNITNLIFPAEENENDEVLISVDFLAYGTPSRTAVPKHHQGPFGPALLTAGIAVFMPKGRTNTLGIWHRRSVIARNIWPSARVVQRMIDRFKNGSRSPADSPGADPPVLGNGLLRLPVRHVWKQDSVFFNQTSPAVRRTCRAPCGGKGTVICRFDAICACFCE